jgi:sensor c-di-GMP phosphodiesterase-like protein
MPEINLLKEESLEVEEIESSASMATSRSYTKERDFVREQPAMIMSSTQEKMTEPKMEKRKKEKPKPEPEIYIARSSSEGSKTWVFASLGGVAALALISLVLYLFIFRGGKEKPITSVPVVPKEVITPEKQRAEIMGKKLATRQQEISILQKINSSIIENLNVSSVNLYGDNLLIEVFAVSRDEVANFILNLKKNLSGYKFEIINSEQKPWEQGGINVLISAKIPSDVSLASTSVSNYSSADEVMNSVISMAKSKKMKVLEKSVSKPESENLFNKVPVQLVLQGERESALSFLNTLSQTPLNFSFAKAHISPKETYNVEEKVLNLVLLLNVYTPN